MSPGKAERHPPENRAPGASAPGPGAETQEVTPDGEPIFTEGGPGAGAQAETQEVTPDGSDSANGDSWFDSFAVDDDQSGSARDGSASDGAASDGSVGDGIPGTNSDGDDAFDGHVDAADTREISLAELEELARLTAERDQYLATSRQLQADMENYRKQVTRRELETRERANENLVAEMLPVLDACDAALTAGATDVQPVYKALLDVLTKQGLERIDSAGDGFDPNAHEAVMHEPADADHQASGPIVAEVLRAGYRWKGRVLRPAMVRVKG